MLLQGSKLSRQSTYQRSQRRRSRRSRICHCLTLFGGGGIFPRMILSVKNPQHPREQLWNLQPHPKVPLPPMTLCSIPTMMTMPVSNPWHCPPHSYLTRQAWDWNLIRSFGRSVDPFNVTSAGRRHGLSGKLILCPTSSLVSLNMRKSFRPVVVFLPCAAVSQKQWMSTPCVRSNIATRLWYITKSFVLTGTVSVFINFFLFIEYKSNTEMTRVHVPHCLGCTSVAEVLISSVYFPCSPVRPITAFAISILESYVETNPELIYVATPFRHGLVAGLKRHGYRFSSQEPFQNQLPEAIIWFNSLKYDCEILTKKLVLAGK